MQSQSSSMPEDSLHEHELQSTGIRPRGSSIDAPGWDVPDDGKGDKEAEAAKEASDAELGRAGTVGMQNGGEPWKAAAADPGTSGDCSDDSGNGAKVCVPPRVNACLNGGSALGQF